MLIFVFAAAAVYCVSDAVKGVATVAPCMYGTNLRQTALELTQQRMTCSLMEALVLLLIASTKEGGKTAAQNMRRVQDRNSNDRALQQVYKQISGIVEALKFNSTFQSTAFNFYKTVYVAKVMQGRDLAAVATAIVFEACRYEGLPRTFKLQSRSLLSPKFTISVNLASDCTEVA